jgi:stringent starvation protein B
MVEDDRLRIVKGLLFDHICSSSQRHARDGWAIYLLAKEIVEKLDHRPGIWRKWNEPREALLKSATHCWIPIEALREYLNGMPGPDLTRMDVAQRLRAFQEEPYGDPLNEDLKADCLAIFEREHAEGTELPAIIGAAQEWVDQEEVRRWEEREAERQKQLEDERIELEQRFLSGADCKWTPLNNSTEVYCRKNGRTYRLSRNGDKTLELRRIKTVEDQQGLLIGAYKSRANATKVIAETAYSPEPRW